MKHLDHIESREIRPGFFGKMVHGEKGTVAWWQIRKGSILQEHRHEAEQFTYVEEGSIEMIIGGEKMLLTPGMTHVIPSMVPHSAIAVTDCKVIDFFAPARDDYR